MIDKGKIELNDYDDGKVFFIEHSIGVMDTFDFINEISEEFRKSLSKLRINKN